MSNQKIYSAGDVVRLTSPASRKTEIVTVSSVDGNLYCFHERGNNTYSECFIEPFDGFRVGDTVWTVKRGKGKIVYHKMYPEVERPFFVRFDNKECGRNPKTTNLIPTESLYKEALMKNIFTSKPDDNPVIAACHKAFTAAQIAESLKRFAKIAYKFPSGGVVSDAPKYKFYKDRLPICPFTEKLVWMDKEPTYFGQVQVAPSAKFKVGDVVYFKNIGHSLCATENPNKYIVISPNAAGGFVTLKRWDNEAAATCRESDLRLWVETKFTHKLVGREIKTLILNFTPNDFVSIKCLPTEYGDPAFYCCTKEGQCVILFGTKGDGI